MDSVAMTQNQSVSAAPVVGKWSAFIFKYRLAWLLSVVLFWVGLDQGTKIWAQNNLTATRTIYEKKTIDGELKSVPVEKFVPAQSVVVIPNAFSLTYAENPAAAFSLTHSIPQNIRRPFLIGVSSLAMIVMLAWYMRMRRPDGLLMTAFAVIVGGAIGNFIDRIRLAYVIDFIDMYAGFIDPTWRHWPTYNIADSCIVVGAGLVIYRTLRPLYPEDDADDAPAVVATNASAESNKSAS